MSNELPDRVVEDLARAVHARYVDWRRALGETPATNASLVAWEALPEELRASNRDQARDIAAKLAAVGCEVVPSDRADPGFAFTADEVEHLSRREHERWARGRAGSGHADLVAWDALDEEARDKDRDAVRHIPALLARAGMGVRRVRPAGRFPP